MFFVGNKVDMMSNSAVLGSGHAHGPDVSDLAGRGASRISRGGKCSVAEKGRG